MKTIFFLFFLNIGFAQDNYLIYVDQPPIFPGCEMITNLKEREECSKIQFANLIESYSPKCDGRFLVSFIITKNGNVRDIDIEEIENHDCNLDFIKESFVVFSKSGINWLPGKLEESEVDVKMSVVINKKKKNK